MERNWRLTGLGFCLSEENADRERERESFVFIFVCVFCVNWKLYCSSKSRNCRLLSAGGPADCEVTTALLVLRAVSSFSRVCPQVYLNYNF